MKISAVSKDRDILASVDSTWIMFSKSVDMMQREYLSDFHDYGILYKGINMYMFYYDTENCRNLISRLKFVIGIAGFSGVEGELQFIENFIKMLQIAVNNQGWVKIE